MGGFLESIRQHVFHEAERILETPHPEQIKEDLRNKAEKENADRHDRRRLEAVLVEKLES